MNEDGQGDIDSLNYRGKGVGVRQEILYSVS